MLFCFGLFALLLYYTVVANAECSHTYRNYNRVHLEADSSEYEQQGYQQCEFFIKLASHQGKHLQLNFTRLSGFVRHHVPPPDPQPRPAPPSSALPPHLGPGHQGAGQGLGAHGGAGGHSRSEAGADSQPALGGLGLVKADAQTPVKAAASTGQNHDSGKSSERSFDLNHLSKLPDLEQNHDSRGNIDNAFLLSALENLAPVTNNDTSINSSQAETPGNVWNEGSRLSSMLSSPLPPLSPTRSPPMTAPSATSGHLHHAGRQGIPHDSSTAASSKNKGSKDMSESLASNDVSEQGRVHISSFKAELKGRSGEDVGPGCMPVVEIFTEAGDGDGEKRQVICSGDQENRLPVIFQYASSVRIIYQWQRNHSSGFTLDFEVSLDDKVVDKPKDIVNGSSDGGCVHTCDGSRCLTDRAQLCNGWPDCGDSSDERTPHCAHLSTDISAVSTKGEESLVTMIVLPVCLLMLVVLCGLCLFFRRQCTVVHHNMHNVNGHSAHLGLPNSLSSEGLTPSSIVECSNEQAVALLPANHHDNSRLISSSPKARDPFLHSHAKNPQTTPPPDTVTFPSAPVVGLPPNIAISPDGEEGYAASQLRLLQHRYHQQTTSSQLFKAPPNKTVFDRHSPPPYSPTPGPTYMCGSAPPTASSSSFSFSSSSPPLLGEGGRVGVGERMVRDSEGYPVVSRCYTMCDPVPRRPLLHHHHFHQANLRGQGKHPHQIPPYKHSPPAQPLLHPHCLKRDQMPGQEGQEPTVLSNGSATNHFSPLPVHQGGVGHTNIHGCGSADEARTTSDSGLGSVLDSAYSDNRNDSNNNSGFARLYLQRPPRLVHGAFTVQDAAPYPPAYADSPPSLSSPASSPTLSSMTFNRDRDIDTSLDQVPAPSHPPLPPPPFPHCYPHVPASQGQTLTVMTSGPSLYGSALVQDRDCVGSSVGGFYDDSEPPPSYEFASRQGRGHSDAVARVSWGEAGSCISEDDSCRPLPQVSDIPVSFPSLPPVSLSSPAITTVTTSSATSTGPIPSTNKTIDMYSVNVSKS